MQSSIRRIIGTSYQKVLKPLFFKLDPEQIHVAMVKTGELLGSNGLTQSVIRSLFAVNHPALQQTLHGITFPNPIGLSAGFDYEAQLTQILPSVGFGFMTVGTITNQPYAGNPRPRLGRLPKSQSLMVNKGFKNPGAEAIIQKLKPLSFQIPVGVSIGRTNTRDQITLEESIDDVIQAFTTFEISSVRHIYYELNISCPNLFGDISFYPPAHLKKLLKAVDALKLSRPVFVKMPIEKPDAEVRILLDVIAEHSPNGIIFGNLQKDRNDLALLPDEVAQFNVGYFSGKPTYKRSNELISLAYKHYYKRFTIIGCGGVFSAEDAIEKIQRGASLVQLITGMIFQGPQLIGEINEGIVAYMNKHGVKTVGEMVGER